MLVKKRHTAAILIASLALTGCGRDNEYGSGTIVSEEREVSEFHQIELSGSGTVEFTQGVVPKLSIETDDNLLGMIETEVRGGILYIGPKGGKESKNPIPSETIYYYVSAKELDKISISGSGEVHTIEQLLGEQLAIDVNGAGNLLLDIDVKTFTLTIRGAGKAEIKGSAASQAIVIEGAGTYQAADFLTRNAEINISGAGMATVNVTETLDVNLSGAGTVSYIGSPKVTNKVSGMGVIKKIE